MPTDFASHISHMHMAASCGRAGSHLQLLAVASADAKCAAFKVRGQLRQQWLRVDDQLTTAQQKSHSER